jgi:alpha-1,2-mannosyltransferase
LVFTVPARVRSLEFTNGVLERGVMGDTSDFIGRLKTSARGRSSGIGHSRIADRPGRPGSPSATSLSPTVVHEDVVDNGATTAPRWPPRKERLLEFVALASVAIAIPLAWWIASTVLVAGNGFNDFHDFYLAAQLITHGQSPYDKAALAELARSEGLHFVVGTGYSYPLPFALAMIPFVALPFTAAVLVFNGMSLAVFGFTVAAWIGWAHGWEPALRRRRLVLACAAAVYPSVYGTIANGQAGLVLLPLLGLGTMAAVEQGRGSRRFLGGIAIGLAAIVKLTPGLLIVPMVLGRQVRAAMGVVLGAVGALAAATVLAPWAGEGSEGMMSLLEPDSYFTNQSINGVVTRLVLPSDRTVPLWNHGFDPRIPVLVLTGAFALLTLLILWKARRILAERRGLALGLGLALVGGLIGAPKGTYWNQVMVLVPAGLLLAVEVPDLRIGRLGRIDLALLACWLAGTTVQTLLWMSPPSSTGTFAPVVTLLTSSSVYGLFALWLVLARRLLPRRSSGQAVADALEPVAQAPALRSGDHQGG